MLIWHLYFLQASLRNRPRACLGSGPFAGAGVSRFSWGGYCLRDVAVEERTSLLLIEIPISKAA